MSQLWTEPMDTLSRHSPVTVGLFAGGVVVAGVWIGVGAVQSWKGKREASARARRKREAVNESIRRLREHVYQTSPASDGWIVSLSIRELQTRLQNGDLDPVRVLRAFQRKAVEENEKYNFIAEVIVEAEEWAKALQSRETKGSLYGVPITLKDTFRIKGYDNALGCSSLTFKPAEENAASVKALLEAGAIPFIKTTVPPLVIGGDTGSPIHGPTLNPFDVSRCVGGSSGGESAAITSGSSPFGFGGDIAGSIRIPAAFCGIPGIKCTSGRISRYFGRICNTGKSLTPVGLGPLGRDVDALAIGLAGICNDVMYSNDPSIPRLPFSMQEYEGTRPLRIGYYYGDGNFTTTCTSERAVNRSVDILRQKGHEVVPWTPPDIIQGSLWLHMKSVYADGGKDGLSIIGYDPIDITEAYMLEWQKRPWITRLVAAFMKMFDPKTSDLLKILLGQRSASDMLGLEHDIWAYCGKFQKAWLEASLDAVVCCSLPYPAPPKTCPMDIDAAASFYNLYVLLDYAAGVVPIETVTAKDLEEMKNFPTPDLWHKSVKKNMANTEGLPVAVQVAAPSYREEVCLRVMKEIEEGAKLAK